MQVKLKFSHMKLTNSPSSITLVLMQPASNGDKPLTSWQSCKKRKAYVLSIQSLKLGFQLVLCTSRSHISLVLGHFLLVLEKDFVRGWLGAWALKVPTGQVSFKKYLPSKKIYFLHLSLTTGWNFFHPCCTMNLTDQNLNGTNFLAHILNDCYCNWQHFRETGYYKWDAK